MSELQTLALLVAVWSGALLALPFPVVPAAVLGVGFLLLRRPWWFVAAGFVLASALAFRAEAQHRPIAAAPFSGEVVLVTDPETEAFRVRAEARLVEGDRVVVSVGLPAGFAIEHATAGSTLFVTGRTRPIDQSDWIRSRHLVGRLDGAEATVVAGPPWWQQPSELIRRAVASSARPFDADEAALYTGLVIGDDRRQSLAQTIRFRSAGMSHLLAVSGQNVAFALAVVWPLARRMPATVRLPMMLIVLAVFAIATRLEPSVIRATVTAGVGAWSAYLGRRATGVRTLGIGVSALVLIDPFLVLSVGFRLSVAATAGIVLCAPLLTERITGPRPLALAVGITASAQLFVAPILILTFGPVSLVTLPANVLAGWAAGVVMIWGLSVGLIVAVVPATAPVLQWPIHHLLWWVDQVARWSVALPAPRIGGMQLLAIAVMTPCVWTLWRFRTGRALAIVISTIMLWAARPVSAGSGELVGGGRYWAASTAPSVLVVDADADRRLAESLVAAGIGNVDLVVFERAGSSNRELATAIVDLSSPRLVLAPPLHRLVGARAVRQPHVIDVSGGALLLSPDRTRLAVTLNR